MHITGLPYVAAPPTKDGGWTTTDNVAWVNNYIYLGARAGTVNAKGGKITFSSFAIPSDINIKAYNYVYVRSNTIGTTYTLSVGDEKLYSVKPGYMSNVTNDGNTGYDGKMTSSKSTVYCESTYGNVGGTHSKVYSIKINYR